MIIGIGSDILEVSRVEDKLREDPTLFREAVFTPEEIKYCETKFSPAEHYAARFAAKEAVMKALAIDSQGGFVWKEAEVLNDAVGRPQVYLYGSLQELARRRAVQHIFLSLSHTASLAAANVVLES
jgi:holo-[acyl-carrier protein] synthase